MNKHVNLSVPRAGPHQYITMAPQQNASNKQQQQQHQQQQHQQHQQQQQQQQQQGQTYVEKLMIGLEHAPPAFNLREQVIGAGGANLHYIKNETGAIATLRGRGSMFIDPILGAESSEPLHLYIEHARYEGLQAAKQLAKNLIETLQQELIHFQQISQNAAQNIAAYQNGNAATAVMQQAVNQSVSQINVPPPPPSMLAVPPPIIQQSSVDAQGNQQTTIVQSNFIQQNPPPTLGGPPQTVQSQPQTIIHQQIIPQTAVPIQLQQGNMVIHQQPVHQAPTATAIGNVNIPPPGIPIPLKTGQIVQFQQPPPPSGASQLTQPPPNVAVAQPTATTTQILLNPAQNYQYQYIQQPVQTGEAQIQPNQVTIQHVYQPQQQIQGIVHQVPSQSQAQQFDQFQQVRSQQFQSAATAAPTQQYITVQGSTAYMVPPPTIVQQQTTAGATSVAQIPSGNPNIIFQPPPQIQQVQMQVQPTIAVQNIPPPPIPQAIQIQQQQQQQQQQDQANQTNSTEDGNLNNVIKEEIKSEADNEERSQKNKEDNSENADTQANESSSNETNLQSTNVTVSSGNMTLTCPPPSTLSIQAQALRHPPPQQLATSITIPGTQVPQSVMTVPPPPMSCVQHIVGNTLITTHSASQPQTHQIYNQVPVSIQQFQPTGQQIHVSAPSGQHFVVNTAPASQWQSSPAATAQLAQAQQATAQMQHLQANGTIQNVQLGPAGSATIHTAQAAAQIAAAVSQAQPVQQSPIMSFNPSHIQVQFQPQMLQQLPPPPPPPPPQTIEQAQLMSGQVTTGPPPPPPPLPPVTSGPLPQQYNMVQTQHHPNIQQLNFQSQHGNLMGNFHLQPQMKQQSPNRHGNKRKFEDDMDNGPPNHQPRMGMGDRKSHHLNQNARHHQQQQQQQFDSQHQLPPLTTSSSGPNNNSLVGSSASSSANSTSNGPSHTNNNGQDEIGNGQKLQIDGQSHPVGSNSSNQPMQQLQQLSYSTASSSTNMKFHGNVENRSFYQRADMNNSSPTSTSSYLIDSNMMNFNSGNINNNTMGNGNNQIQSSHRFENNSGGPGKGLIPSLPHLPRGHRFHHGGNGLIGGPGGGYSIRPPSHHLQDNSSHGGNGSGIMNINGPMSQGNTSGNMNYGMHRMNFGPPPPSPYRQQNDCPPNMGGMGGNYIPPPPPRFRGQW